MISTENERKTFYRPSPDIHLPVKEDKPSITSVINDDGEELFRPGQLVPAGCYVEVDGYRQVILEKAETLPASLDGRRALYRRLERPWVTAPRSAGVVAMAQL